MKTTTKSILAFVPKSIRDVFKMSGNTFAEIKSCMTHQYCYVVYLTRVQGDRDKMWRLTIDEWDYYCNMFINHDRPYIEAANYIKGTIEPHIVSYVVQ